MPRPTRTRSLLAPGLSLSSLRRISLAPSLSGLLVDDAHEMLDLVDHATHGRSVLQRAAAVKLVETEADQRLLLPLRTAARAADLLDRDRPAGIVRHVTSFPFGGPAACRRRPVNLRPRPGRPRLPKFRRDGAQRSRRISCRAEPQRRVGSPAPSERRRLPGRRCRDSWSRAIL